MRARGSPGEVAGQGRGHSRAGKAVRVQNLRRYSVRNTHITLRASAS